MNQNLPNSMRNALARQATPDTHPSPDLLTAFVEHALSGGENQRVTEHLAGCAECREIVFLAASAADEPVANEQDWMATTAPVPRISPALLAKAHPPQTTASASPSEAPRRRWSPRLVWTTTLAAAVLLVSGLLLKQRFVAVRTTSQLASEVASSAPTPRVTEPQRAVAPQLSVGSAAPRPDRQAQAKTARAKRELALHYDALGVVPESSTVAQKHSAVPSVPSGSAAIQQPSTSAIGEPLTAAAPAAPHVNSFAASEAKRAGANPASTSQLMLSPPPSTRSVGAMHPLWRITADGHLEHFGQGGWTRVLVNQSATFRVVSVIGDEVWVGGNGGALFHSSDKGQQWGRVSVVTSSGTVTATIVSIQFDDLENGVVITEGGSRYRTSDGGVTWSGQ